MSLLLLFNGTIRTVPILYINLAEDTYTMQLASSGDSFILIITLWTMLKDLVSKLTDFPSHVP